MLFDIKVFREPEGIVVLRCEASGLDEAVRNVQAQGYQIISSKTTWARRQIGRRYHFPLALFSQELMALLGAGLSLLEGIETLGEKEKHEQARTVFRDLTRLLREGQPLSRALQQFPQVFPPLYIATIRASEKTGDLQEALTRYLSYEKQIDTVRKKVVNASIYPILLLIVGALVVAFLMMYVVPRFSLVYEDMGDNLPWMSQMLMQWGRMIGAHAMAVVTVTLSTLLLTGFGLSRPATRLWLQRRLWRIPAVGQRMRLYQLARFYRTLSMLLHGGIPLMTSLEMVSGLLQPGLRDDLLAARQDIREGRSMSESMEKHGLTTEIAIRMLRVGERSGNLGEMSERIANFYDEEMARWIEWFIRLFEPLLMIFIGLVIGLIVLLMYMPIFELAGNIQ